MTLAPKLYTYTALSFLVLGAINPAKAVMLDAPTAAEMNDVIWTPEGIDTTGSHWSGIVEKGNKLWLVHGLLPAEDEHTQTTVPHAHAIQRLHAPQRGVEDELRVFYTQTGQHQGGKGYSLMAETRLLPYRSCTVSHATNQFDCEY